MAYFAHEGCLIKIPRRLADLQFRWPQAALSQLEAGGFGGVDEEDKDDQVDTEEDEDENELDGEDEGEDEYTNDDDAESTLQVDRIPARDLCNKCDVHDAVRQKLMMQQRELMQLRAAIEAAKVSSGSLQPEEEDEERVVEVDEPPAVAEEEEGEEETAMMQVGRWLRVIEQYSAGRECSMDSVRMAHTAGEWVAIWCSGNICEVDGKEARARFTPAG
jgi:hypothetical protein